MVIPVFCQVVMNTPVVSNPGPSFVGAKVLWGRQPVPNMMTLTWCPVAVFSPVVCDPSALSFVLASFRDLQLKETISSTLMLAGCTFAPSECRAHLLVGATGQNMTWCRTLPRAMTSFKFPPDITTHVLYEAPDPLCAGEITTTK